MKTVLIFGATSDISIAYSRLLAKDAASFILVSRNGSSQKIVKNDLVARGASNIKEIVCDLNDVEKIPKLVNEIFQENHTIDEVFISYGVLPDPQEYSNPRVVQECLNINSISPIIILTCIGDYLGSVRRNIAVVTSVAGDRGRGSNYLYGASKAIIQTYIEGFRAKTSKSYPEVTITDVRPGIIDTKMTKNLSKKPLLATANTAALVIKKGIEKNKDVIYTPSIWKLIMFIIKVIPRPIFKRLNL